MSCWYLSAGSTLATVEKGNTHTHQDYLSSEKGHKMGETFLAGDVLLAIEMKDTILEESQRKGEKISNSIRTSFFKKNDLGDTVLRYNSN